jgi:hypothetical protein
MADVQQQPRELPSNKKENATQSHQNKGAEEVVNPRGSTSRRKTKGTSGTVIYPNPTNTDTRREPNVSKDETETSGLRTSSEAEDELKIKKNISSLFMLSLIPAGLTIYRTYYANGGPTWFSFRTLIIFANSFWD